MWRHMKSSFPKWQLLCWHLTEVCSVGLCWVTSLSIGWVRIQLYWPDILLLVRSVSAWLLLPGRSLKLLFCLCFQDGNLAQWIPRVQLIDQQAVGKESQGSKGNWIKITGRADQPSREWFTIWNSIRASRIALHCFAWVSWSRVLCLPWSAGFWRWLQPPQECCFVYDI